MWIKFTVVDNGSLLVVVNGVRYLVTTVDHPVLHALLTIVKIMVDRVYSCVPKAIVARFKVAGIYYRGMALILFTFYIVKYVVLYYIQLLMVQLVMLYSITPPSIILYGLAILFSAVLLLTYIIFGQMVPFSQKTDSLFGSVACLVTKYDQVIFLEFYYA